MDKIFSYFKKSEIRKLTPVLNEYISRKKVVTFVPLKYVDKLTFDMSSAGAGMIGNYTVCSFRMKGVGTFLPGKSSKPFIGKKGKLAFEEEVRLEMECGNESLESVIDALLKSHPYEEPAYEIYEFRKRANKHIAVRCDLKKRMTLEELIYRFNNKVVIADGFMGVKFSRILFLDNIKIEDIADQLKFVKAEVAVTIGKKQNNISII